MTKALTDAQVQSYDKGERSGSASLSVAEAYEVTANTRHSIYGLRPISETTRVKMRELSAGKAP